ncbi:meiosis inhibitor protein 1-like [Haliotis asinina]|uniref:meiosis inhibitor protein 1-like n=1 Tax=Haliotis asinina TaxID=109174 RepID=UPI003531CACA
MEVKNYGLMEKGFCLLANILHRQPLGIPLFVNVASVRQCVNLVRQGLALSHPAVFLHTLTAAGPLVSKQYLPWVYRCEVVEDLLKVACSQMTSLNTSLCHGGQKLIGQGTDQQYPLVAFTELLTVCCRVCADTVLKSSCEMEEKQWMNVEGTLSLLLSAAERHLAPHIQTVFDPEEYPAALKPVLTCMNELYSQIGSDMSKMSLMFTRSGVIIQAHVVKSRATEDVCESIDKFLENVYRDLLEKITPLNPSPPSWLVSGVTTVRLPSSDPCHIQHVLVQSGDTAWTLLVMLYFSYLYSNSWVECCDLQSLLQCFLENNRDLAGLPPLVIRCLAFLIACSSGDAVVENPQSSQYQRGLGNLIDVLGSCPLHVWYTHHPVVICWVFSEERQAVLLGNTLLEYWLPLIDMINLETALVSTRAQYSCTGSQHIFPDEKQTVPEQQCENTEQHVDTEQIYAGTKRHQEGTVCQLTDTTNQQRNEIEANVTDTAMEMDHSNVDTQLLVELAHNSAFINTLMSMLVAQQEIADIAANVTEQLAGMLCDEVHKKAASATPSTVSVALSTCTSLFQELFLQDSVPEDYQVINLLKVMIILMRGIDCNISDAFSVKSVYHVVKFVGSQKDDTQSESVKWCVEYLLKYKEDRVADCLCVSPILIQNKGFMMRLERILSGRCHAEVDSVMRLVAWLASSAPPDSQAPHQIHLSHSFLLDTVTTGNPAVPAGGLCLLSAALSTHSSTKGPVVFSRDRLIQDTPLFTARDVRTLYFHLQQQICQDCLVVFSCALECIYKLYMYAATTHKSLASHLSSQPWNKLWLETMLHTSLDHVGLIQQILKVLHMLSDFPACQTLIAVLGETFLHTVLKSSLQEEETETVTHILSMCMLELKKNVKPHLLQQVKNHLQQGENKNKSVNLVH